MKINNPQTARNPQPKPIELPRVTLANWVHPTQSRLHPVTARLPYVAGCALVLATVATIVKASLANSELRNAARLPVSRWLLLCYALTVLNVCIILAGVCLSYTVKATRQNLARRAPLRGLIAQLPILVIGIPVLLYTSSEATYWRIGTFVDNRTFLFIAPNPLHFFIG